MFTSENVRVRTAVRMSDFLASVGPGCRFAKFKGNLAGEKRGTAARRGNHLVEAVVAVGPGINYRRMVQSAFDTLSAEAANPGFVEEALAACLAHNLNVTEIDVRDAINGPHHGRKGLLTSYAQTLAGSNPDYSCEGVYEPLVIDSETVPGVRVYTGRAIDDTMTDEESPVPGTLYFDAITISMKVIDKRGNPDKLPKNQGPVQQVKAFLAAWLDLRPAKFRTYRVLPGAEFTLSSGSLAISG